MPGTSAATTRSMMPCTDVPACRCGEVAGKASVIAVPVALPPPRAGARHGGLDVGAAIVRRRGLRLRLVPLAFETLIAREEAGPCAICALATALLGGDAGLGVAVVTHERNVARAHVGAAAALDAVEEVRALRGIEIARARVPVEFLGQKTHRAHVHAGAAADAGELCRRGRLPLHEDTVGGLGDRDVEAGHLPAHHRPAHDDAHAVLFLEAAGPQAVP